MGHRFWKILFVSFWMAAPQLRSQPPVQAGSHHPSGEAAIASVFDDCSKCFVDEHQQLFVTFELYPVPHLFSLGKDVENRQCYFTKQQHDVHTDVNCQVLQPSDYAQADSQTCIPLLPWFCCVAR